MMTTVTVYQFEVYRIDSDEVVKSRRWGTREAIRDIACGRVLEGTAREVDESVVASDIHGFTKRDFDPDARPPGFQTHFRR
jgi:hypothetical protein